MAHPLARPVPQRAEIWEVQLAKGKTQLAVVLSANAFNQGPRDFLVIAWITDRHMYQRFHVELQPRDSKVTPTLYVKCDEIETIKKDRLQGKLGEINDEKMREIEDNLQLILGLPPYRRGFLW